MNEGPQLFQTLLFVVVPILAYFLGVVIRKKVFPLPDGPPLKHQLLLALPLSLGVVGALMAPLGTAISDTQSLWGYLIVIGVIMEHGLFMNEKLANVIAKRRQKVNG